jgi:hypothetical protein
VDFLRKRLPAQVGRYLEGVEFPARKEELLGRVYLLRAGVPRDAGPFSYSEKESNLALDEGLTRRAPKVGLLVADRPSASVDACFCRKPYDRSFVAPG